MRSGLDVTSTAEAERARATARRAWESIVTVCDCKDALIRLGALDNGPGVLGRDVVGYVVIEHGAL